MMSKAPISIGIQPQTAMFAVLFTAVCGAGKQLLCAHQAYG